MKVALVFGTRPEAIKLAPLILAMRDRPRFQTHVCVTGQHREMLDQVLKVFDIVPDRDLGLMRINQTLADITARAITALDEYFCDCNPDLVIVQGDTTTVLCASIAAFYRRIPVAHVEAGLRTGVKMSPFPEEVNRVLTSHIATHHFAPTPGAKQNLLDEGIAEDRVLVTGNTVVDSLHRTRDLLRVSGEPRCPDLPYDITMNGQPFVLITGHRRENFGKGFDSICKAISALSNRFPNYGFVYPVHLNPNVRETVFSMLGGKDNVHLIDPLSYLPFVALMEKCRIVLTDSGGVQEEAQSFGKPVLVMRDTTERPEGVEAGVVRLCGTNQTRIVDEVSRLLTDDKAYESMANSVNPYGDGKASERILDYLEK